MTVRSTLVRSLSLVGLLALLAPAPAFAGAGNQPFVRGDANNDGAVDIGDAIFTLGFLFSQGTPPTCMDAADSNDDGAVDIGDAIYTLAFLFSNGAPPPPPFPAAGLDPTTGAPDVLVCGDPCAPDELCNGVDDDCDGLVDEDPIDGTAYYIDLDADGFGDSSSPPVSACTAPPGHVGNPDDCDDSDPDIHPGAPEFCDGVDQDCDGTADDGAVDATAWWPDLDNDSYGSASSPATFACTAPPGHVGSSDDCDDGDSSSYPGAPELCDGLDNDCDGFADQVTLDEILEPARPPYAMPGRLTSARLHASLALDATDPAGSVARGPRQTVCMSRLECILDEVDLVLPGVETDFVFVRRYRSRHDGASGVMGHQWEHCYEIRYSVTPSGLLLRSGDNREDLLVLQPDGVHYGAAGLPALAHFDGTDLLVEFGNGGSWRLAPSSGGGGGGSGGRISVIAGAHGNPLLFSYDSADRLATITDTVGRVVTLSYGAAGTLVALDDGTGRVWTYSYYAPGEPGGSAGDLKSVTSPAIVGTPTGNDFPLGRTTLYTYSSGSADPRLDHNLLSVTDARGTVRLVNEYDDDPTSPTADALIAQEVAGHRYSNDPYCEDGTTVAGASLRVITNDDRGAVTEYFFDALHRCVLRRDFTGFADPTISTSPTTNRPGPPLRSTDPLFFETRYDWNSDHRLVHVVYPDDNEIAFVYERDLDPLAPLHLRTNLRQVVRTPGTHLPAGPFSSLVDSYEVAPGFGGFAGHQYRVLHTDARGSITITVRDSFGNPTQVQRPVPGVVEDLEYDSQGRLTAHVRASHAQAGVPPERRRDEFTYHTAGPGAGLLATRSVDATALALTTSFDYDARGHVVLVVHPSGNDESFLVNALGEPIVLSSRAFDSSGTRYETRCFYDPNGNRVRVDLQNRDADGVLVLPNEFLTRIREYDPLDRLARTLDEKGTYLVLPGQLDGTGLPASEFVTTEVEYDVSGRLVLVRSGEATSGAQPDAVLDRAYDERGLLFASTWAAKHPDGSTTQWAYTRNGHPARLLSGIEAGGRETVWVYDGFDRLVTATDPMGNIQTFDFDENGNLIGLRLDGELVDLPGSSANVRLSESICSYDALDRRIARSSLWFDLATQLSIGDGGNNDNWDFTGSGALLAHTDDSGDVTSYEYDSAERLLRVTDAMGNQVETTYDAHSNVISEIHQDLSSSGVVTSRVWSYTYDGLDRRTSSVGPLGETRTWAHAWFGVGRVIDERGNVERHLADSLGRVIRVEGDLTASGAGGTAVVATAIRQWQYDDNGRRVAAIDPNGHGTTFTYDPLDRLVEVLRADGTTESATYDAHGQRLTEVDASGTIRSSAYDDLARCTSISLLAAPGVDGSATFATFSRDGRGRVRVATNDDVVVAREWDSLSYLTVETVDGLTVQRATDDEGRTTLLTYPSGRQLSYLRDPLGRVSAVTEAGLALASYSYLGPQLVEERDCADGSVTEYQYDLSRRLVLVNGSIGVGSAVQHAYAWDAAGDLVTRADSSPGGTLSTSQYSYDSLERLIGRQTTSPLAPPAVVNYQLDVAGNRLFVGGLAASGPYLQDPTLPEPADAQMHQYTTTPSDAREYSAAGELTAVTSFNPAEPPKTLSYDALGRLRVHQVAGAAPTEYDYDALGRLVRITSGGDVTRFALCGDLECAVHDALGTEVASYVHAHGTGGTFRVGMRAAGLSGTIEDFTFHSDSAGSVVLLTDSTGAVVDRYEYGDHGQLTVLDAAGTPQPASLVGNVHLFHGHRYDLSSRLHIIQGGLGSYMDEATGRLLSVPVTVTDDKVVGMQTGLASATGGTKDYLGGNPTSRQRLLKFEIPERNLTPEQSQLRIVAGKGIGDGDGWVDDPDDEKYGGAISCSWWGHCNGWAALPDYRDPDDDNDGFYSGRAALPDYLDDDDDGDTVLASVSSGALSIELTESSIGSDQFHTTTPGHKYVDTITLRGPMTSSREHILLGRQVGMLHTTTPGLQSADSLSLRARRGVTASKAFVVWVQKSAGTRTVTTKEILKDGTDGKRSYNLMDAFPTRYIFPSFDGAGEPLGTWPDLEFVVPRF